MAAKPNGIAEEGKKKGGQPAKVKKASSGRRRGRRLTQAIKQAKKKILKFEARKRAGFKTARELIKGQPNPNRWDTKGLQAHVVELEEHKKRIGEITKPKAA